MLKIFSKRTLSLVLSVFMLMTLVPMVSAADDVTVSLANLTSGATEFTFEDMTGESVHLSTCLGKSPDSVCYDGCQAASSLSNNNQPGLRNRGKIGGFTQSAWNGETINAIRGAVETSVTTEPGNETNYVLKMTGQGTGADDTFSSVDFRSLNSKAINNTNHKGVQIWETKVKLPESTTGQLRLFAYDYAWAAEVPATQISTQVHVENGAVYRIDPAYNYDPNYSNVYSEYTDCIASGLEAGQWYTFVRLIDLRNDTEHYDRVFVYDAAGNMLNLSIPEWRIAGEISNKAYHGTGGNLGIGHEAKNFAEGEDVYFDDIRIWHITNTGATVDFAADRIEGTNHYGLLTANGDSISKYVGMLTGRTYIGTTQSNTQTVDGVTVVKNPVTYLQYKMDINLGSVDASGTANLFSQSWANWGFNSSRPVVKLAGGAVQVMEGTSSAAASAVMKADDVTPLVLEADTWYTLNYIIKFDSNAEPDGKGNFVLTVTNQKTGEQTVEEGNAAFSLPTERKAYSGNGNLMIGAAGYSKPIKLDNMSLGEFTTANCESDTNLTYSYLAENFESLAFGTWGMNTMVRTQAHNNSALAPADTFVVEGDGNYISEGIVPEGDVRPITIALSTETDSFATGNVIVNRDNELLVENTDYTLTFADTKTAKLTLTDPKVCSTYEISVVGLEQPYTLLSIPEASASFYVRRALDISGLDIYDINGAATTLPETGKLKATVTLNNVSTAPSGYALILALYSDEGLADVAVVADSLAGGGSVTVSTAELDLDSEELKDATITSAKAMLWDGFQTLVPLTGDVVISPAQ